MAQAMHEFDLIARIAARAGTGAAARADVVLGIGDDAALLRPPAGGRWLAVSSDTLNVGVHFSVDDDPADLGWKALAVNLSDLAAMAAEPAWCLLALSLPSPDPVWLDGFLDGFEALRGAHGLALVGGDTTRGPLSITVTVIGSVGAGQALRRSGARAGEDIWVTGTLGDAAAALVWSAEAGCPAELRQRLRRPTPRVEAGQALQGLASAAIDVSDGLLADLGHILVASGVGAEIELAGLPCSPALAAVAEGRQRWQWQCGGGDDYELCFTAPVDQRAAIMTALAAVGVSRIGRVRAEPGLRVIDPAGRPWQPQSIGYRHFAEVCE